MYDTSENDKNMKPKGYKIYVHRKTKNLPFRYLYIVREIEKTKYLCNEVTIINQFGRLQEIYMNIKFSRECQLHYITLIENFRTPTMTEMRETLFIHLKMVKL